MTVCVNRTALEFTDSQIQKWLAHFGTIEGNFVYHKDKFGLKTDNIEVELKLKRHIPEFLPMYSRRIRIFYLGMKKQCNNCLEIGHIKPDCKNDKRDWFSYIESLVESKEFEADLFGDWPTIIKNKRKELSNKPDPKNAKSDQDGKKKGKGKGRK